MTLAALTTTILTFTAIVVVGVVLRSAGVLSREDARPINAVIIYAGLPALIFHSVHGAQLRSDLFGVVVVAWLVFGAMLLLSWGASRLMRLPKPLAGGFILAFVLVGLLIAQHMGEHDEAAINPLKELVTFPAFIALVLALLLRTVAIPGPVSAGLELLGNMVAPLIMLSVGLSLRARTMGRAALPLAVLVGMRLLLAPAIAMLIGSAVLGSGDTLRVVVLEAGMPAMMLSLVAGERFGLDTDFIASAIFLTTALSAVALPLVQVVAFR